jgi:hypothetical protein
MPRGRNDYLDGTFLDRSVELNVKDVFVSSILTHFVPTRTRWSNTKDKSMDSLVDSMRIHQQ